MQLLISRDYFVIRQLANNWQRRFRFATTSIICLLIVSLFFMSCGQNPNSANAKTITNEIVETKDFKKEVVKPKPAKIIDIPLPDGYKRVENSNGTFGYYLHHLALDTIDQVVHLYDGRVKGNQDVHYAIINMDVGKRDLQQCADAVMRLRAEFLYENKYYDDISFQFTNGDWVDFNKYAKGYRPKINGNKVSWSKTQTESFSYKTFRNYMDLIFTYAGTLSLSKQLNSVDNFNDIKQGDVIIIGGSPGHAVIVVDMAIHEETKEKIYMIAQSYMPAQEIHILKNMEHKKLSPWYKIPNTERVITPEYYFSKDNLMRF